MPDFIDLPIALPERLSFSKKLPTLQIGWDSTSLRELFTCPRKYYLTIILGFQPVHQSDHLTFGLLMHTGLETYHHARADEKPHEEALLLSVRVIMSQIGSYRRDKDDREVWTPWTSLIEEKTRFTAVRALIWYLDLFKEDVLTTARDKNGRALVELPFRFDLDLQSLTGEDTFLCGHLDRVAQDQIGQFWITDIKTSKYILSRKWFDKWTPDIQMSTYSCAGKVVFHKPIKGVMVDGVQVTQNFSRFMRGEVRRTKTELEEYLTETRSAIMRANEYASDDEWPANFSACHHYGGCPFLKVCSKPRGLRKNILISNYTQRFWDPLKSREN